MSRFRTIAFLAPLTLAGILVACSALNSSSHAPGRDSSANCDASKVEHLIGENVSGFIERQAMTESGAQDVRVLKPDSVATMDFNPRRLNIHTDPGQVIIKLACG